MTLVVFTILSSYNSNWLWVISVNWYYEYNTRKRHGLEFHYHQNKTSSQSHHLCGSASPVAIKIQPFIRYIKWRDHRHVLIQNKISWRNHQYSRYIGYCCLPLEKVAKATATHSQPQNRYLQLPVQNLNKLTIQPHTRHLKYNSYSQSR